MVFLGFHSLAEVNVYITFVLLGMAIMMVLGIMLSAPSFVSLFYIYATGKPDAVCEKPWFWNNALTFFFAVLYSVQFTCESLTLTNFIRRIPLLLRLLVGLSIPFIELLILYIVPIIKLRTQDGAIAVIIIMAIFGGFSKAVIDTTTNAIVGPFPTKFVNGEQWGISISPLLMSIVQIILKYSMSDSFEDVLKQCHIYLGIGMFFQLLTVIEILILYKNPFAQKYNAEFRYKAEHKSNENFENEQNALHNPKEKDPNSEKSSSMLNDHNVNPQFIDNMNVSTDNNSIIGHDPKKASQGNEGMNQAEGFNTDHTSRHHHGLSTAILRAVGDADKMVDVDQVKNIKSTDQMLRVSVIGVAKRVWPMLLCTFFTYYLSLLLFPGLFFKADVGNNPWYFTLVVFLFNFGDFLGRILLMHRPFRPSPKAVLIGAIGRSGFIPLLILCANHVIKGSTVPYILSLLVSMSNGYFGTMASMYSPRTPTLTKAGERSLAGILSGIFLMLGLCAGSNSALLLNLIFWPK
ncbi:unnamed protein product [Phytomonas sp. Hart1]|nr:unnamed protein product [Phytomonas sp. Hart1]|eukprot:CCW66970.1 unnamed protein product [Phytomonas sp. isolate Hart1]